MKQIQRFAVVLSTVLGSFTFSLGALGNPLGARFFAQHAPHHVRLGGPQDNLAFGMQQGRVRLNGSSYFGLAHPPSTGPFFGLPLPRLGLVPLAEIEQDVRGVLIKTPSMNSSLWEIRMKTDRGEKSVLLRPGNPILNAQLESLDIGDWIQGAGFSRNSEIVLSRIDFLGLTHLLGLWSTEQALVNFADFDSVETIASGSPVSYIRYRYAITPYSVIRGESTWRIFFSTDKDVSLANLSFSPMGNRARVAFLNPDTGLVVHEIELSRIGDKPSEPQQQDLSRTPGPGL